MAQVLLSALSLIIFCREIHFSCNLGTIVQMSLLSLKGDYILKHMLSIFWGELSGPAIVSAFSNKSVLKMNPVMF